MDSDTPSGTSVGNINLINVDGIVSRSTASLVPDTTDFSITIANSSSFTVAKTANTIFINPVQLTLIVSSTLSDDSTIVDYTEVTVIPTINFIETREVILAEGTRNGSFVSDIPGLNKYASSDGHSYSLTGDYSGFFSVDGHGDIFCSKTISFEQMGKSADTYAFVTEIQIYRSLLVSDTPTHVARLSVLIVRDKFSQEIREDTLAESILGRFDYSDSSANPFDFALIDVSAQRKFSTYFTYNTHNGALGKSSMPLDFTIQNAREFQFEIRINWKSHEDYIKVPGEMMVNDVNNHPPVCVFQESFFQVISGSPSGTYIGLVQTSDVDTVGKATYSITDVEYSEWFSITPHSGVLIANRAVTASQLGDQINLTVNANDGYGRVDCHVVVEILKLTDENANLDLTFAGTLREEQPWPVHAANVFVQNYTNFKFMTTRDNEYFELNSTTGEVTSQRILDREHLPPGFRDNTVTFGIQANLDDEDSCTITIMGDLTITVTDINDNSPCFRITDNCTSPVTFEGEITEEVHGHQEVIFKNPSNIEFFDPDENDNNNLTVTLTQEKLYFIYGVENNVIQILTSKDYIIDREKIDHLSVTLSVTDGGTHTATATVMITVLDVNDNQPEFTEQSYTYNITENAAHGENVGTVKATDKDTGLNAEIKYSIFNSFFSVDEKTGKITTKANLDRESIASYNIPLYARDSGQPSLTTTTTVSIQIDDVNDNDPVFLQHEYRFHSEENNSCSNPLGSVSATDADEGNNGAISFNVSNFQEFTINGNGEIFCRQSLDYESNRDPSFYVTATDGGSPSRSSTTHINIEVFDKNDNPPKFTHNVTIVNVTHTDFDSPRLVALFEVTDRDTGDNGRFQFELCTNYNDSFTVTDSGAVYTTKTKPSGSLSPTCAVKATDKGVPPLCSSALVEFFVGSSSDSGVAGVRFNSSDAFLYVAENYSQSVDIGILRVLDNKTTAFTFTMISSLDGSLKNNNLTNVGNTGSFYLDPRSGMITKYGVLDRETKDAYRFLASVEEANAKDLILVTINVTDVNEPPRFVTTLKQFGVKEDAIHTALIPSPKLAEDDDLGENGTISYSLIKQEPISDGLFNFDVNSTNGTISVVRALDYEAVKRYNITIEVQDKGTPDHLSATQVFEVIVNDVNDNPPTFVNTENPNGICSYSIKIKEDTPLDSVVLDFAIHDNDGRLGFQESKLSVIEQNGCPLKPVTHAFPDMSLLSNATLDYESQTSYVCVIKVTNTAPPHLSNNCSVHVKILDVNDNSPQTYGPYVVDVTDGKINDVILVINATDADSDENSRLVYNFTEETEKTFFFGIDPSKGSISIIRNLFQFTSAQAELQVKVSDSGNPPLSNTTEVVINIISNNTEPWFPGQGSECSGLINPNLNYRSGIQEEYGTGANMNEPISNSLLPVTACDKVEGEFVTCNCSYRFVDGPNDYFDIDTRTGMVRQIKPVDREVTPYFLLNITATDHGYPPRQSKVYAVLTISVADLDDNPPYFKKHRYQFDVPNNRHVGDPIGYLRANDPDYGENAIATYTMLENQNYPIIYNNNSGNFSVSKPLTNLTGETFSMLFEATGVTTKTFTGATLVEFKVFFDDPNKSSPTFNQSVYAVTIPFSATKDYMIGQYIAVDADEGIYGELEYHLESTRWETFVVDSKSGMISLQHDAIDAIPYYIRTVILTLVATDGGIPSKTGFCLINITLTGLKEKGCSNGNDKNTGPEQDKDSQYETPLYVVIAVAACLLLILVIGFLVMFSRNRVVLTKYNMSQQRLSTLQDPYDLKNESYQRLSKQRSSGEYNKSLDYGFEANFMHMKEEYDQLDEYDRVHEPEPDYDTTPI